MSGCVEARYPVIFLPDLGTIDLYVRMQDGKTSFQNSNMAQRHSNRFQSSAWQYMCDWRSDKVVLLCRQDTNTAQSLSLASTLNPPPYLPKVESVFL